MIKMDYFSIYVSDDQLSKRWYAENFGLNVEFEVPERNTVALVDDADVTSSWYAIPKGRSHRIIANSRFRSTKCTKNTAT